MESSFAMALGLAAIDGLLSAFVAMLMLALVLIGSGETSGGGPDWNRSTILLMEKSDPRDAGQPMRSRMLIDVYAQGEGRSLHACTVESAGKLEEFDVLKPIAGHVFWSDCSENTASKCEARLMIVSPKPGSMWLVRLRIADTFGGFSDDFPSTVNVKLTSYTKTAKGGTPTAKPLALRDQLVFGLNPDTGQIDSNANLSAAERGSRCQL